MFTKKQAKILYKEIKNVGLEDEMLKVFNKYIVINEELNRYHKLLFNKLEDKTIDITEEVTIKLLNENVEIATKIGEFQKIQSNLECEVGNLLYKISNKLLKDEPSKNFNKVFNLNKFRLNQNQMIQLLYSRIMNKHFLKYLSIRILDYEEVSIEDVRSI